MESLLAWELGLDRPRSIPIRILTHNVRYATQFPFRDEELWPIRAPKLLAELRFNTRHNANAFICLQEVLHGQLVDIQAGLNSVSSNSTSTSSGQGTIAVGSVGAQEDDRWDHIGVGRDDGKTAGEYSPIFFRPSVWKLLDFQTVWLSETPDRPSKGWDAASIRIVTIGKFEHRPSGRSLIAMSTHMDDQGAKARLEGAKLIVREIANFTGGGILPVLLAGDFNSETTDDAYKVFASPDSPVEDLRDRILPADWYGDTNTFTGFSNDTGPPARIDFLFIGKKDGWNPKGFAVLENRFEDGIYNSDHRAVVGDVVLG